MTVYLWLSIDEQKGILAADRRTTTGHKKISSDGRVIYRSHKATFSPHDKIFRFGRDGLFAHSGERGDDLDEFCRTLKAAARNPFERYPQLLRWMRAYCNERRFKTSFSYFVVIGKEYKEATGLDRIATFEVSYHKRQLTIHDDWLPLFARGSGARIATDYLKTHNWKAIKTLDGLAQLAQDAIAHTANLDRAVGRQADVYAVSLEKGAYEIMQLSKVDLKSTIF